MSVLLCVLMLTMTFSGCGSASSKSPSKLQIIEDLSQEDDLVTASDNTGLYSIKNIEIKLADTVDDIYEADIVVELENRVYSLQRNVTVTYKKYDVGGWILEDVSGINTIKSTAIGAYPESAAVNNARNRYDNVKLESHETDLKNLIDVFTFSSTYNGDFFNYTISFEETYSAESGTWQKVNSTIKKCDSNLNAISGLYYFGNSEDAQVLHFNDDSTVTMLIGENLDMSYRTRTTILTEKPTYEFDEETLSYTMHFDRYVFTITQNEITYYNNTLSNVCFFDYKWLRENFYDNCVGFLKEDQKRNQGKYSSDPSSTITQNDVYGIWDARYKGVLDYYFKITASGVDYATDKYELNDVNSPEIDLLFYGYDEQRQAYVVYFCERIYTTSSFYVDRIHVFQFVKTSNGTIELKSYSSEL